MMKFKDFSESLDSLIEKEKAYFPGDLIALAELQESYKNFLIDLKKHDEMIEFSNFIELLSKAAGEISAYSDEESLLFLFDNGHQILKKCMVKDEDIINYKDQIK